MNNPQTLVTHNLSPFDIGVPFVWKGAYSYEIYQNFNQSMYYSP